MKSLVNRFFKRFECVDGPPGYYGHTYNFVVWKFLVFIKRMGLEYQKDLQRRNIKFRGGVTVGRWYFSVSCWYGWDRMRADLGHRYRAFLFRAKIRYPRFFKGGK